MARYAAVVTVVTLGTASLARLRGAHPDSKQQRRERVGGEEAGALRSQGCGDDRQKWCPSGAHTPFPRWTRTTRSTRKHTRFPACVHAAVNRNQEPALGAGRPNFARPDDHRAVATRLKRGDWRCRRKLGKEAISGGCAEMSSSHIRRAQNALCPQTWEGVAVGEKKSWSADWSRG